jgi:hypothetical protein
MQYWRKSFVPMMNGIGQGINPVGAIDECE